MLSTDLGPPEGGGPMPKAPLQTTGQLCTQEGQPHLSHSMQPATSVKEGAVTACPLGLSEASTDVAWEEAPPSLPGKEQVLSKRMLGTVQLRGDALAPGHTTKDRQS